MSVEENKKAIYRAFEEVWNKGNYSIIPEVCSPDYVAHSGPQEVTGLDGFEQYVRNSRTSFPDLCYTVDEIIGEGDTLAIRLTMTGTFAGKMGDIEPTGNSVNYTFVLISRFTDGKCIESNVFGDSIVLYQQMGVTLPMG
jgi:predicted ester cyclase